jgi:multiple sugar transport system substrate-binding protein/raffinose/stachyose/melibiose transport system substrate-binding protein
VEVLVAKDVLIYNSMHGDPDPRAADEEIVKMFMEANPDIEVVHSIVAHEDFKQAIRAYLTASTPPDVMTWFAGNRARFFIDNGQIMDISDVWESEGWNESYPKGFQALSTVDGKQYFLPTSWYWWAVYYRVSIFEELGLEPPETWDEFLAVNETLKENGYTPLAIGTKYRWTAAAWFDYLNMRINGPQFHIDLMLGKESYDDPRVAKVFEYWRVLLDNGYFLEDAAAYSWSEALEPFIAGEAAMYLMGDFIRDSLPDEIEADVDFFRFPIIDPSMPIGEDAPTDGYFLAANATNVEAAKKFLAYLGSVEVQTYNAEKLGRLPTNSGVDRSMFTDTQQKGMELIDGADFVAQFYDRDTTPEMADEGMNAFMAFWDDPDSIDVLLADLELARKEIFEGE